MDESTKGELTERQQYWLDHLKRCAAEGVSLKAYASQHGLALSMLYSWNRRLKDRGLIGNTPVVRFTRVQVPVGQYRLHFPNGLVLEWEGQLDEAVLTSLMRWTVNAA